MTRSLRCLSVITGNSVPRSDAAPSKLSRSLKSAWYAGVGQAALWPKTDPRPRNSKESTRRGATLVAELLLACQFKGYCANMSKIQAGILASELEVTDSSI